MRKRKNGWQMAALAGLLLLAGMGPIEAGAPERPGGSPEVRQEYHTRMRALKEEFRKRTESLKAEYRTRLQALRAEFQARRGQHQSEGGPEPGQGPQTP
jgi:hypothetical protein